MNSLEISSIIRESLQNNEKYSQILENQKQIEQVFMSDLQTIEKISLDEDFWNNENNNKNIFQPVKTKNILESIDEEDEDFVHSLFNQKTTRTVEMANNFLKNLALPLDDFPEKEEISRFSNRISFRSSKFNRMSFDFSKNKSVNKSLNVERLSRLSVMACELDNSQYFNFEKKEVLLTKENDFVEKDIMLNFFDVKSIDLFTSMSFVNLCAPLNKLHEVTQRIDVFTVISDVSLNILVYVESEEIFIEKFVKEIEFLKGKLLNYLELIKTSELYLKENIDVQKNYQQILFKKNPWILNMKRMASNLLNLSSMITRISPIQISSPFIQNKIISSNNFFMVLEDYKNIRTYFYQKALDTIQNFFGVQYNNQISMEEIRKILQMKIYKVSSLFKSSELSRSFSQTIQVIDEMIDFRKMLVPLWFEELENIVILIDAYVIKYKNSFNIYQNYTLLVNEVFYFRRFQIKSLRIKIENFHEKFKIIYKNYTQNSAKATMLIENKEILLDLAASISLTMASVAPPLGEK